MTTSETSSLRLHRGTSFLLGLLTFSLLAALVVGTALTPQSARAQDTYTVNSSDDDSDDNVGDGDCDTGETVSGDAECTLRAALEESNDDGDSDTIEFSIPSSGTATITATAEFQATNPVVIDGTSAPSYPRAATGNGPVIQLDGSNLSASNKDGIQVASRDVSISGLAVNNFQGYGINVLNSATSVSIEECFVGLNFLDGFSDEGNGKGGLRLDGNDFTVQKNIISQNGGQGVRVSASTSSTLAVLQANIIGLDVNGDDKAANDGPGVHLTGGSEVEVGFLAPNYISGNGGPGVLVESAGHDVEGNLIGTDTSGTAALGNSGPGIRVLANDTRIATNTISGNDGNGVGVGNSSTSVDNSVIESNTIGLDEAKTSALPNGNGSPAAGGIICAESSQTGSGNTTVVQNNTIAGNDGHGIWMTDNCYDWDILDNYIGTNFNFDTGLGNQFNGVNVKSNPSGNGEEVDVVENIIGANDRDGVDLRGGYHDVSNNYIGVAPDGTDLGNGSQGVIVQRASPTEVEVGGTVSPPGDGDAAGNPTPSGDGNVIGYNGDDGILIQGDASGIPVRQNYVGTNPSDADYGNGGDGIRIVGNGSTSTTHEIGYDDGLIIASDPSPSAGGRGNVVAYNAGDGVSLGSSESSTDVGDVSVRGNITYQNGGATPQLGIDLGNSGITSNDGGDTDDGPNRLQNFPEILSAGYDANANQVSVTYQVPSDPNASGSGASAYNLTVDFYQADADRAEGEEYLGTDTYTASNYNNGPTKTITFTPSASVTQSDDIVATATDANGNTSEFSASAERLGPNVFTVDATGNAGDANPGDGTCDDGNGNCTLPAAVEEANSTANSGGPDRIEFDIPGTASPSSPHVIQPASIIWVDEAAIIDGTTEPDYGSGSDPKPVVEVDGTNAGTTSGIEFRSSGNTIRGLAVINYGQDGIRASAVSDNNQTIQGCHVGVRADGSTAAGNGATGINLTGGDQVGGTGSDDGNIIGANDVPGIDIDDNTVVQGNFVGTNANGADLGNGAGFGNGGVTIDGSGNTIGGTAAGEANVIANNSGPGVRLFDSGDTGNTIVGNRIFANSGLGIDLADDGRTANDDSPVASADDDDGANRLQNFPEIQGASYDANANQVTVTYEVPSQPGLSASGASTYPIEVDFYRAETSTQDAEGEAYLHSDTYVASDFNNGPTKTVMFTPSASVTRSDDIVATATDANGNTSEFSTPAQRLPVELVGFEGTVTEDGARLTWQTTSETNNAGFEVQRQEREEGWTQIGYVESKAQGGTTTETKSYSFTAEDLPVGTHQFRLKQVDIGGGATFTDPVSIDVQMQEAVKLTAPVPNPVSSSATLSFAAKEQAETRITLYNTLGQRVRTFYEGRPTAGERQRIRLDTGGLSSGTYFLRLQAGDQVTTRRLTVVQ